jgi:type II secretory pathway pseudopilin PulG
MRLHIQPKRTDTACGESGFTIVELIIAAAMMVVITGAAVSLLVSALQSQPEVTQRANQIGDARNLLEELTVDLRQGSSAEFFGAEELGVETICDRPGGAEACNVAYECEPEGGAPTFECMRTVEGEAPTGLITGLSSGEIFCVTPSAIDPEDPESSSSDCGETNGEPATYVGVTIEFPASDQGGSTVLEGGAALHNAPSGEAG